MPIVDGEKKDDWRDLLPSKPEPVQEEPETTGRDLFELNNITPQTAEPDFIPITATISEPEIGRDLFETYKSPNDSDARINAPESENKTVYLPDINKTVAYPSDMTNDAVTSAIQQEVYGKPVNKFYHPDKKFIAQQMAGLAITGPGSVAFNYLSQVMKDPDEVDALKKLPAEAGKGLVRSAEHFSMALGGVMQWFGEYMGQPWGVPFVEFENEPKIRDTFVQDFYNRYAGWGEKIADYFEGRATHGWEAPDSEIFKGDFNDNPSLTRIVARVVEMAMPLAIASGITFATKSPTAGAKMLGLMGGGTAYHTARKSGEDKVASSVKRASYVAGISTIGNTLFMSLPLGRMLSRMTGQTPLASRLTTAATEAAVFSKITLMMVPFNNTLAALGGDKAVRLWDGLTENLLSGAATGALMGGFTPGRAKRIEAIKKEAKRLGVTEKDLFKMYEIIGEEMRKNPEVVERIIAEEAQRISRSESIPAFADSAEAISYGRANIKNKDVIRNLMDEMWGLEPLKEKARAEGNVEAEFMFSEAQRRLGEAISAAEGQPIKKADTSVEVQQEAPWMKDRITKQEDALMRDLVAKEFTRGEPLTEGEQAFAKDYAARLEQIRKLSPAEASALSEADFKKWGNSRVANEYRGDMVNDAYETAIALRLRGEVELSDSILNRIQYRQTESTPENKLTKKQIAENKKTNRAIDRAVKRIKDGATNLDELQFQYKGGIKKDKYEYNQDDLDVIGAVIGDIRDMEAYRKTFTEDPTSSDLIVGKSGFVPDYLRDWAASGSGRQAVTKAKDIPLLEKALKGEPLTAKQKERVDEFISSWIAEQEQLTGKSIEELRGKLSESDTADVVRADAEIENVKRAEAEAERPVGAEEAAKVEPKPTKPEPKTRETKPEKDIAESEIIKGRLREIVAEQDKILKDIDVLAKQRDLLTKAKKPTKAIDKKLDNLAEKFDAIDAEIGDIMTSRAEDIALGNETVKLTAKEVDRIQSRSKREGARLERDRMKIKIKEIRAKDAAKAEDTLLLSKLQAEFNRLHAQDKNSARAAELRQRIADVKAAAADKAADIVAFKQSLTEYVKKFVPKEARGKLLESIRDIHNLQGLDKAIQRADMIAEDSAVKSLNSRIRAELKSAKPKKVSGKLVGKLSPEGHDILAKIEKATKLTKEQAVDEILRNLDSQEGGIPSEEVAIDNQILDAYSGMKEMNSTQLRDLLETVQGVKNMGRSFQKLANQKRAEYIKDATKRITKEITGKKGLDKSASASGIKDKDKTTIVRRHINKLLRHGVYAWEDLLDIIVGKSGLRPGEDYLSNFADVSTPLNAERGAMKIAMARLHDMLSKSYGLKTDAERLNKLESNVKIKSLGKFKNASGKTVDIEMSKSQAIKKWMELQDPTLKKTFFSEEGMGWTPEIVEAMNKFLTPADRAFGRDMLKYYREIHARVNPIYKSIYGVNLPFNEFYSPIRRANVGTEASKGFSSMMKEINHRQGVTSKSLKTRKKNTKPLKMLEAESALNQHVVEMERFINWAQKIRDLNTLFGKPKIEQAIIENYGSDMYNTIIEKIGDFAVGGNRRAKRIEFMDTMRLNFAKAKISLAPSIGIKQLMSLPAYLEHVSAMQLSSAAAEFFGNYKKNNAILNENPFFDTRGENITRDIKAVTQSEPYHAYRAKPSWQNLLLLNVKGGDRIPIQIGGWALYKQGIKPKSQGGKGLSKEAALQRAAKISESTQQSGALSHQSNLQSGGSISEAFTIFQSAPTQYLRRELAAIRHVAEGRITPLEGAKLFTIYHFVLPMTFQFMSDLGWDTQHQARAAILGNFNSVFLFGDFMEQIINRAFSNGKYGGSTLFYSSVQKDFEDLVFSLDPNDMSPDDVNKAVNALLGAAEIVPTPLHTEGIPWKRIKTMIEGLKLFSEGNFGRGTAGMAGWSQNIFDDENSSSSNNSGEYSRSNRY